MPFASAASAVSAASAASDATHAVMGLGELLHGVDSLLAKAANLVRAIPSD